MPNDLPAPAPAGHGEKLPPGPAHNTPLGLGLLEQRIMTLLWDVPGRRWLTLGAVTQALDGSRPPSSVQATLLTLTRKGHVTRGRASGRHRWRYRATVTREDFLTQRILTILACTPHPEDTLTRVLAAITQH